MSEVKTGIGRIVLTEEVVSTIAAIAATSCDGVAGMASHGLQEGLVGILGRDSLSRGVEVREQEAGLWIRLHIVVAYGWPIKRVADQTMEEVRRHVEETTDLPVARVEVSVESVELRG